MSAGTNLLHGFDLDVQIVQDLRHVVAVAHGHIDKLDATHVRPVWRKTGSRSKRCSASEDNGLVVCLVLKLGQLENALDTDQFALSINKLRMECE